jgi:hypothetical protein
MAQVTETYDFNETQRATFHKFQAADYALYNHFYAVLIKKIADELPHDFMEEVMKLKEIMDILKLFCQQHSARPSGVKVKDRVKVKKSRWNEAFVFQVRDCLRMTGEVSLVDWETRELLPP